MDGRIVAPKSFWADLEYTGGCGPKGWHLWFPQSVFGVSIWIACKIHDWMYDFCEKDEADYWFLLNMVSLIKAGSGNRIMLIVRYVIVRIIAKIVKEYGWLFYTSETIPDNYEARHVKA